MRIKKSAKERAFGIALKRSEFDVLLASLKIDNELFGQREVKTKNEHAEEDTRAAQEIRNKAMER